MKRSHALFTALLVATLTLGACAESTGDDSVLDGDTANTLADMGEQVGDDLTAGFSELQIDMDSFANDVTSSGDETLQNAWTELQTEWQRVRAEVESGVTDVDSETLESQMDAIGDAVSNSGDEVQAAWDELEANMADVLSGLS